MADSKSMGVEAGKGEDVGVVALFNASDDTIDMVKGLLAEIDEGHTLVWCHFADLKKGVVNFQKCMEKHDPDLVIFDISPPYDENWTYFKTMRDSRIMKGRGTVLTTTNKSRLDAVLKEDSMALEVVGLPEDLKLIKDAIQKESARVSPARRATVKQSAHVR